SDRTPHNYGVVAEVRCGLMLRIGNVCGSKNIKGFEEIDALAKRLEGHDRDNRSLDEQPRALLAFYEWLQIARRPFIALRYKALPEADSEIVKEIDRRRRLDGGQRTEVLVRGEQASDGSSRDFSLSLDLDFMLMEADSSKI